MNLGSTHWVHLLPFVGADDEWARKSLPQICWGETLGFNDCHHQLVSSKLKGELGQMSLVLSLKLRRCYKKRIRQPLIPHGIYNPLIQLEMQIKYLRVHFILIKLLPGFIPQFLAMTEYIVNGLPPSVLNYQCLSTSFLWND